MDIKIGTRTFLEFDSDEKESKPRRDLYLKLVEMAPDEPSEEEHLSQKITKKRYMSWRERSSCSSNLGFRIEAIKVCLFFSLFLIFLVKWIKIVDLPYRKVKSLNGNSTPLEKKLRY